MPTFRTQRPGSIADSLRVMLGSSPQLTAADKIAVERGVADIGHKNALAEKVRVQVEQARAQERERADPNMASDYASYSAGVPTQTGRQFRRFREGEVDTDMDTGDVNNVQRPEISPDQERAFSSHLAATIANRIATGKTNAEQMTHAGGNLLLENVRRSVSGEPNAAVQNAAVAPWRAAAREPYSNANAQGVVVNQEQGSAGPTAGTQSIYDAAVANVRAQAAQHGTAATLNTTRAGDITTTQPGRLGRTEAETNLANARTANVKDPKARPAPGRTDAQEARDRAYADRQRLETEKLTRERDARDTSAAAASFRRDPKMKGMTTGGWVAGKGLEVKDASGKVVGYYTK